MTHAWIDPSAGVAGDMLLGALFDAGASLTVVQAAVEAVVAASVLITTAEVTRAGLRATKAEVTMLVDDPPHRTWATVQTMITDADLADPVRTSALAVFGRLAAAEGRVHGIPAADVHFHEVGALDSIADVVGVCAALDDLGVETVSAGPVALGSGQIQAAHGTIPVPVPAVAELSTGWRVSAGGQGELTTPTGMALLVALASTNEDLPALVVRRTGVGAGTKDVAGRANVTRVVLGVPSASTTAGPTQPAVVLEANVDDLDPRLWPDVLSQLLRAGADDAWLVPIVMKKGRPAHVLSVLCVPERAAALQEEMILRTSTLGVRRRTAEKYALPRVWVDVDVLGDVIAIKVGHVDGEIRQVSPEFDAVSALALAQRRPQQDVLVAALAAAAGAGLAVGARVPPGARPQHRSTG
ncbi:MAG: nickel pincer cofactor biosynthesis protein LarC [Propionibacteriaceae bacterium]